MKAPLEAPAEDTSGEPAEEAPGAGVASDHGSDTEGEPRSVGNMAGGGKSGSGAGKGSDAGRLEQLRKRFMRRCGKRYRNRWILGEWAKGK